MVTAPRDAMHSADYALNEDKKEVELKDKIKFTRQRKQSVDEQQNKSAVTDHVVKENHVIGWDEANILCREGNRSARWIRESIEIRKQDIQGHTMNRDAGTLYLVTSLRCTFLRNSDILRRKSEPEVISRKATDVAETSIINKKG